MVSLYNPSALYAGTTRLTIPFKTIYGLAQINSKCHFPHMRGAAQQIGMRLPFLLEAGLKSFEQVILAEDGPHKNLSSRRLLSSDYRIPLTHVTNQGCLTLRELIAGWVYTKSRLIRSW